MTPLSGNGDWGKRGKQKWGQVVLEAGSPRKRLLGSPTETTVQGNHCPNSKQQKHQKNSQNKGEDLHVAWVKVSG